MQQLIAAVIGRQEAVDRRLVGDVDDRLGMGEEGAVATDRDGQEDPLVLGHPVGDQRRVQRFLRRLHPDQHPAQVADGERVVMLDPEGAGIVERPVADHGDHRQTQPGGHRYRLEGVEPADAAGADEYTGADRRGVLDDLELGMFALGDDEFAVEIAVGNHLGNVLHDGVVGPDRVGRDDVDIGQPAGVGDRLGAADQLLRSAGDDLFRGSGFRRSHRLSPRRTDRHGGSRGSGRVDR